MKNLKRLFVLVFCFTLMITTTTVPGDEYLIKPIGHHSDDRETIL